MRRRDRHLIVAALAVIALVTLACTVRFWPREPLAASISSSTAVFDRHGRLLRLTLARDEQYRLWTSLDDVSPEFLEALLLHEDQHFYRHFGFNPFSLVRATFSSYLGGPRIGGSTITMQLARLKYELNTRTIPGKLHQILRAMQLELCYSKQELLEAHINLMPYGGNVQGVGAASLIYFDKSANRLDLAQSLSLVLIPQSPSRRSPRGTVREPLELGEARQRLFTRWLGHHPEASTLAEQLAQPLELNAVAALPFEAPHYTEHLLREHRTKRVSPSSASQDKRHIIASSLDLPMQQRSERVLKAYVAQHRSVGIHNAAALIVDYRDMTVRALIGSADFGSARIEGQVDGTAAKRSPGSALKPFIYALAIDQGLIHPLSVLKDAPTSFGPFSPENFDGRFVGPITASDALSRSRNIPAIALSSRLANPNFYQLLKSAGVADMASEQHYGLALALGGGEVTMQEAATLYAMLANRGVLSPLNFFSDTSRTSGPRLLSEEASFMTLAMLRTARPGELQIRKAGNVYPLWKTGTSWGFRDAWTAGVLGPYVIVVWVGNFDGQGNPAFVGIEAAAPLFFRLVDSIAASEPRLYEPSFRQPPRLEKVEICTASGDLPNAECPKTTTTWYIPGVSPMRVSQLHRRVWIDERTGAQACPPYDPAHTRSEIFEFWPTDLLQLFAQAGMPRRRPPPSSDCQRDVQSGTAPSITSPVIAASYTIRIAHLGKDSIPLSANADSEVRRLHWFIDESYVGTSAPSVALGWKPQTSGRYLVRAIDDRGRVDTRELRVELVM